MVKIPLRVYNREIEKLIEGGQLDEAIAHCQHILKTFSMHIETYQLLGKAYLESHRHADAVDIFQRILNAAPDDFISHVGMSIIRDDEGRLDESIWHMERAFEVQPSNPAIQGELRRLYGRRDGVEPPKIRLSRDALANMYAQGELFNQAIVEIRSVLAEDPDRPDLQVILARAYLRVGQKVEAAEISAQLLKKYPYCLDALRILVVVLQDTARGESTQVYRQRLQLLDPYSSFVSGSVFDSSQVAESSVTLERLDYQPGRQSSLSQPTWASTLGITLNEETHESTQPEWQAEGNDASPLNSPPSADAEQGPEGEAIPDFLRSAGWSESDGKPSTGDKNPDDVPSAEGIFKGEMPDWLKSQIPSELSGGEKSDQIVPPDTDADFPDWLTDLGEEAKSHDDTGGLSSESSAQGTSPDQESFSIPLEIRATLESIPEGSQDTDREEALSISRDVEDANLADTQEIKTEDLTREEPSSPVGESSEEFPEWLVSTPPEQTGTSQEAQSTEEQPQEAIEPAGTEHLDQQPTEINTLPELSAQPSVTEQTSLMETDHSPMASGIESTEAPEVEDDTIAWLDGLGSKQEKNMEESGGASEGKIEELPEWLKKVADEDNEAAFQPNLPESQPVEASLPIVVDEPDSGPIETAPVSDENNPPDSMEQHPTEEMPPLPSPEGGESKSLGIDDGTMGWLESLALKQGAKMEELITKPEDRSEVMPDWLQKSSQEPGQTQETGMESKDEAPISSTEIGSEDTTMPKDTPEIIPDNQLVAPLEEQPAASMEEDLSITTWLNDLDNSALPDENPSLPASPIPSEPIDEDIPDWMHEPEIQSPHPEHEPDQEMVEPKIELPEWMKDQAAGLIQEQSTPLSTQAEEEIQKAVDDEAESVEQPAPTIPAEWVPVDNLTPVSNRPEEESPVQEVVEDPVSSPPDLTIPEPIGNRAPVPGQEKDTLLLTNAQKFLESNQLNESMKEYSKLIRKGHLLDEVIHDLRQGLYRFPVDIIVWQCLGDAYMRANRLQDALDAYTKAEELLR